MGDAQLVLRARGGDQVAFDRLLARHAELLRKIASDLYIPGDGWDDLHQEAQVGFLKAVADWRAGRGMSFRSFVGLCVRRQLYDAVTAANRPKRRALRHAVCLHAPVGDEDGHLLEELLPGPDHVQPHEVLLRRELISSFFWGVALQLSELEEAAILGIAAGYSYREIAELRSDLICEGPGRATLVKQVDNALLRARKKLRRGLEEEDLAA